MQKAYVEAVDNLINPQSSGSTIQISFGGPSVPQMNPKITDAISIAKAQLRSLQTEIRAALPLYKDANSRAHLQDVLDRINQSLNPKQ